MKAIPVTVRERIVRLYDQGKSTREIAAFSGFCVAAVRRVRQQFKQRGTLQPQTHLCGRKSLLTTQRKARLQKLLAQQPDATLSELGAQMDRRFGTSTVDVWLRRLGWSRKKTLHVAAQRSRWHEQLASVSSRRLVFVDESGANTKLTRLYGRAPVGERLLGPQPQGHYQINTLIAGIRLGGTCAPWLFEGAMDGEMFLAWVRQGLVKSLQPADIVIMDNLATHKVSGVRQAIEAAGARLLYLPPYSPDFNPIENLWSKVKSILRCLCRRTAQELLQAAAIAFAAISATDCKGFFLHAKYAT